MNRITPQRVYEIMRPPGASPGGGLPESVPPGLGRLTLEDLGARYGVELDDLLEALAAMGLEACGGDTLKDLASEGSGGPRGLYNRRRTQLRAP